MWYIDCFFSSRRRHTRCALVTEFRRVLFRAFEQAAEPLGTIAIETPLPERGRREHRVEIGVERFDGCGRHRVGNDAISLAKQVGGPATVGGGAHAAPPSIPTSQIGSASCRERVCQYV